MPVTAADMVPLAHSIARREAAKHRIPYDEVLSDALYGLALADHRRAPGRPLAAFARATMEGEVMHGKRRRSGMRADRVHARPSVMSLHAPAGEDGTIADEVPDERQVDPAELVEQRDVWRAVELLDARSQRVVRLKFQGDLSQVEIAHRLGISQMQVSRILRRALVRLRAHV